MPPTELTPENCELILQSLRYTKRAFENYSYYPSYEFKLQRLSEADQAIQKIRQLRKRLKGAEE